MSERSAWCQARALAIGFALAGGLTTGLVLGGCGGHEAAEPSSYAVEPGSSWAGPELADFSLVERSGAAVTRADLLGRPTVLAFIFTTCTGPCPSMSAGMLELQDALSGQPVRLVSVSVDPELDTVEVLAAYADDLGADPDQWWFLTGAEDQIVQLATSVYMTPQRAPEGEALLGEQVTHATKFVVLDGEGVVRGFYDGQSPEGRKGAAARALRLAR